MFTVEELRMLHLACHSRLTVLEKRRGRYRDPRIEEEIAQVTALASKVVETLTEGQCEVIELPERREVAA